MKIKIEIELGKKVKPFIKGKTVEEGIHEALCLLIHEGDEDAGDYLSNELINIDIVK